MRCFWWWWWQWKSWGKWLRIFIFPCLRVYHSFFEEGKKQARFCTVQAHHTILPNNNKRQSRNTAQACMYTVFHKASRAKQGQMKLSRTGLVGNQFASFSSFSSFWFQSALLWEGAKSNFLPRFWHHACVCYNIEHMHSFFFCTYIPPQYTALKLLGALAQGKKHCSALSAIQLPQRIITDNNHFPVK